MTIKLKCLSHTPLRGLNDPGADVVAEVDAVLARSRAEVEAFDPELIVIFAPDHYNGLFYDLMPPFVIATAAESVADYGTLPGPLSIPRDLALDLTRHILDSGLDIALSHRLQVDHGCTQTLEELTGSLTRYPVIPIIINSVAPPFAPYRRIRKLGEAVGRFVASLGKRVLILGTGGLSHEPPVPLLSGAAEEIAEFLIAGRNPTPEARAARQARTIAAGKIYGTAESPLTPLNTDWDLAFIDLLVQGRLAEIDDFVVEEISTTAGRSTHEIRTWVAAFAALAAGGAYRARQDYYRPINEWIAGYGVVSAERR
ncbi:3-(2,3-dihydroxyphenyl)propionate dioxygenase [Azotobacter vinelandii CA]|uniref:2,3-dihydroxyphenylpropionate/2,3-dihydroxicinnamic acid 1,2-dioxygenase n=2 Tax=Azotobacter vinelandii TaxID=354 RepID=MHPB_AZOVD|nr:3-carboxyethylcatechol 2,3-dioxygenase [Azotobacter vinelandii]C1DRI2.1 RecName: Full=2,3-dihydroxyphenylpropionate/2,3-dihydroxicinnamic acid 1,2-dioxygenase; AltName: Full=3-carboxyethylcatechol 2,3-dioxygenase [Azotobacter vinelandii DJ]ACO77720.1 Extradiol ring-cleavage dioxygenase, class III enzyme, subunit B [Azotobacter vinelandii DJ]AGK12544.1 3-(2,3-dihydroxyphenyl)propionate dioxygenase [Azotobacter vinelandii CA]AGK18282.1 3-(2,3-dihydroxyphenyl)propionate dioxygenase [Azotobacter